MNSLRQGTTMVVLDFSVKKKENGNWALKC